MIWFTPVKMNFRDLMHELELSNIWHTLIHVVAVMNISHKGWLRFRQSSKGEAGEAMVQEPCKDGVLLKVDASKLRHGIGVGEKLSQLVVIHTMKN